MKKQNALTTLLLCAAMGISLPPLSVLSASGEAANSETTTITEESQEPTYFGDVNTDKSVDAADSADLLIDAAHFGATGEHLLSSEALANADSNGDGLVNASDAANILIYAAERGANPEIASFYAFMQNLQKSTPVDDVIYLSQTFDGVFRTLGCNDRAAVRVFSDQQSLADFAASIRENGDENMAWHLDSVSLTQIADSYAPEWFDTHDLIAVITDEGMTDYLYELDGLTNAAGVLTIHMKCHYPMMGSPSIAGHVTLIETDKSASAADSVQVEFEDIERQQIWATSFERTISLDEVSENAEPIVIHSREELAALGLDTSDTLWTGESNSLYSESSSCSLDTILETGVAKGKDFFDTYDLILVQTAGESSMVRYYTYDVNARNGVYEVMMAKRVPEICTADETYRQILIRVAKPEEGEVNSAKVQTDTYHPGKYLSEETANSILLGYQCSRVQTSESFAQRTPVICNSVSEIEAYLGNLSALSGGLESAYSEPITDAAARYNEAYFESHSLIIVPVELSSGSIWMNVQNVTTDDDGVPTVRICRNCPAVQTCDMAEWYVFVDTYPGITGTPVIEFSDRMLGE